MNLLEGYFFNPTKGQLLLSQALDEIVHYMSEKPERFYDVIVGCDSASDDDPTFPLVLAVVRTGEGGRFFLKKVTYSSAYNRKFSSWKNRIIQEVLLSCEFASSIKDSFFQKLTSAPQLLNYQFRYIHADIGENGQTRDMIKELTGLIRGNGFEPKIKPESYVASSLADRYS